MGIDVDLIYDGKCELAEGPVWHDDALWWVSITSGELNRLDVVSGINQSRALGDLLSVAVPCRDGRWVVGRRRELGLLDWQSGAFERIAVVEEDKPENRFNDGKCDPVGRFWAGTMNLNANPSAGSLYCVARDKTVRQVLSDVTISNGLGWSPDGARFYYIDTATQRIDVFYCDVNTGAISDRQALVEAPVDRGSPDGLTVDSNGNVWVALWEGSAVHCYSGRTGELMERVELPVPQVTSCCFGGPELDRLYITTANFGGGESSGGVASPAGGIFSCRPGVTGLPQACVASFDDT